VAVNRLLAGVKGTATGGTNAKTADFFFNGTTKLLVMPIALFGLRNGLRTEGFTEP
jgi:hypothetical protein